jgi:hypothetical protein
LTEDLFFYKTPAFKEESEWRLVRHETRLEGDIKFRAQQGILKPYAELSLRGKDGKLPLSQAIVGPFGNQELLHHSADLLLKINGYRRSIVEIVDYTTR